MKIRIKIQNFIHPKMKIFMKNLLLIKILNGENNLLVILLISTKKIIPNISIKIL